MTTAGALMFAIWVTANVCAIFYCVRADWPMGSALRSIGRVRRTRPSN